METKRYTMHLVNGKLYAKRQFVMDFLGMKMYMVHQLTQEGVFESIKLEGKQQHNLYELGALWRYKMELESVQ